MTRWLLIVLMVLLPAQFSWAAAARYCAHESNPVSFHVGHHTHVHEGAASAEAQHASSKPEKEKSERLGVSDHGDCHYCHGVAGQLAAPASLKFEPPERHVFLAVVTARLDDARPSRIERPKWARAA
ncbi:MAG TPA: cobalt-zinc-cadmium resistance protein [Variovorax sp.]|nr:cobalt-zinc-cadmium resistance protein [Variovorax sp.]